MGRDVSVLTRKSATFVNLATALGTVFFVLYVIDLVALLSYWENMSDTKLSILFSIGFALASIAVAALLITISSTYRRLCILEKGQSTVLDVVLVLSLFLLGFLALPFVQTKLNQSIRRNAISTKSV